MSIIRKNNYWVDENDNRWDCTTCHKTHALTNSETMIECRNCTNCYDCKYCTYEDDCQGCNNGKGCSRCRTCDNCMGCEDCETCEDCKNCVSCELCSLCSNNTFCTSNIKCTNCVCTKKLINEENKSYLNGEEKEDIKMSNKEAEPEWLARVKIEREELSEKIVKLITFLGKRDLDESISTYELYEQARIMLTYLETLGRRIRNANNRSEYCGDCAGTKGKE